ncbi:type II secretion system F family protein [Luteococcus peritonei]|uniref:Type II secretion system F family protein n=1 Tax=Luteococcus peritonei TaxID=88874 RepID=A0ABW4RT44_9ACTN
MDKWWKGLSRARRLRVAGVMAVALLVFLVTGWGFALLAVPAVAFGVPALLAEPGNRELDTLEALDRWLRAMATTLPTGKSVVDAMRSSARQAPDLLAGPLQVMVARMDARWSTREALLALAEDLDSSHADAVVAALVLASQRGGAGTAATLGELADTIQARLRALREIEAERAKPRVVVRQVTLITLMALSAALLLQPGFFTPYTTPVGQVVAALLALAYVLSLWALRRMTVPRRRERILQRRSPLVTAEVDHG